MKKLVKRNKRTSWLQHDVTYRVLKEAQRIFGIPKNPVEIIEAKSPDPAMFSNPESFRLAYWAVEMFSKYPDFRIKGLDRRAVALATFHENELRCRHANNRLVDVMSRPIPERYRRALIEAKRLMAILFRDFSVDEVVDGCRWGPGATTSMRRSQATSANKWVFGAHITEDALPWFYAFQRWSGRVFTRPVIVKGNKVTTVPKNAKTDRTIAIEPDWNMFFQLGFGRVIRNRLRSRFGLLQKYSSKVNAILAREGSKDNFLATIDLKGASDGVSLALVEYLVPPKVFSYLCSLRSKTGVLPDGSEVTYEKISSMGNGYTFELETAIFYCLVRGISGYATCYGDDIITTSTSYSLCVDFLAYCGFEVNEKKSHYDGPFRESCGGHFFMGVDVTPPYVKKRLIGIQRIAFCNRIRYLSYLDFHVWLTPRSLWKTAAKGIPQSYWGPLYLDGCLHTTREPKNPYIVDLQTMIGKRLVSVYRSGETLNPTGSYYDALWSNGHSERQREPYSWSNDLEDGLFTRTVSWCGAWQGYTPWSSRIT